MSEKKLCPFRRVTTYQVFVPQDMPLAEVKVPESDFPPCLEGKCAMWRHLDQDEYSEPGYCGLAGKP